MVPARPVLNKAARAAVRATAVSAPAEEEPAAAPESTKGRRAPRSCVICQSFTCKGRGGRHHCPQYDKANPAHQVPESRRYKRPNDLNLSKEDEDQLVVPPDDLSALTDPRLTGHHLPPADNVNTYGDPLGLPDDSFLNSFIYDTTQPFGQLQHDHDNGLGPSSKRPRLG
jgi:hypothetical protein